MINDNNISISEKEYRELDYPSYSLLSSISKQGIDVLTGVKTSMFQLKFGSLVDDMCFEPSKLSNYYRGTTAAMTAGNPKKIIDLVLENCNQGSEAELSYYDDEIISAARKLGVYGKYDDAKILKTILIEKNENYFSDKLNSIGKVHIKDEMWQMAEEAANTLKTHDFTRVYFDKNDGMELIYQYKFVVNILGTNVKGMLDCLVIDHESKTIYPVDLKTGESPANMFDEVMLLHKYYLQASLYRLAIKSIVDSDPDLIGYTVSNFEFVYLSKMNIYKPTIWVVPDSLYQAGLDGFVDRFGFKHKGVKELLSVYNDYQDNQVMYEREVFNNEGRRFLSGLIRQEDEDE